MRTVCLIVAAGMLCQPARTAIRGQETPTFSANSDLVVLHVTVRDKRSTSVA